MTQRDYPCRTLDCTGRTNSQFQPYCDSCRVRRAVERWEKAEKREWDEEGMVYSDRLNKFYSDMDAILDDMAKYDITDPAELRLYHTKPEEKAYATDIVGDYWSQCEADPPTTKEDLAELDAMINDWLHTNCCVYTDTTIAVDVSGWEKGVGE